MIIVLQVAIFAKLDGGKNQAVNNIESGICATYSSTVVYLANWQLQSLKAEKRVYAKGQRPPLAWQAICQARANYNN